MSAFFGLTAVEKRKTALCFEDIAIEAVLSLVLMWV
jgi:hypothetical protein